MSSPNLTANQMMDVETKKTIVQSHIAKDKGIFSKEQNLRLKISEEGGAIVDEIVFTFIVLEFRRRVRIVSHGEESAGATVSMMSGMNNFVMS